MKNRKWIFCAALACSFAFAGGALTLQNQNASADSTFAMENGASLRLNTPEGLRFEATISDSEKATYGENATYGMLLLPQAMLGENELKFGENGEVAVADTLVIESKGWQADDPDDGVATYSCVLAAEGEDGEAMVFPAAFYNVPVTARGYVVTETGDTYYTTNTVTRSIGYVAKVLEAQGLTTADETKELYAGVATIAAGTTASVTVQNGEALLTGDTCTPVFTIGGIAAEASTEVTVSYESSNTDVLSVNGKTLTAVGVGTATVTAKITSGGAALDVATVDVEVKDKFAELRKGDDANTLFFFNEKVGEQQASATLAGLTYGYTTEKAYGNEAGSLKVNFPNTTASSNHVNLDFKNYAYSATDYAVFYIYNDTTTDCINLLLNYEDGIRLNKGEWTMVIRPMSQFAGKFLNFYGQNLASAGTYFGGANVGGSVYISKAKVYTASQVVDLVNTTGEWTIGNTTFVSTISAYNSNPKMEASDKDHNMITNVLESKPYLVNGEFRQVIWRHSYAGFYAKLKTATDVSSQKGYVAVTLKGALADKFTIMPMDDSGEWGAAWGSLKPIKSIEGKDGFVTYVFEIPETAGKTIDGLRITPCGNTGDKTNFVSHEIRISDILVGNAATMTEKGYRS